MSNILIVDDDEVFSATTKKIFSKLGHQATTASNIKQARLILESEYFDLMILDIMLPDGSGLQLFASCDERQLKAKIALVTGHPAVKSLVKSLFGPNITYLTKPLNLALLKSLLVEEENDLAQMSDGSDPTARFGYLVGESDVMQQLYKVIERVAKTSANILLQGESGVGKELVARAIHACSNNTGSFVATNCGALPRELVGSELFGHEKGAFTGAVNSREGLFERARDGTLFLDEITEMPLEQQPILLRVLETKTVVKVGGTEEKSIDCRVISATNRDMDNMIDEKCLREDLYFRLAVFPVSIPPLRKRGDDITLLARHFLSALNVENETDIDVNDEQLQKLSSYDWPGNVRELRHTIHRAYIMADITSGYIELPEKLESPYSKSQELNVSEELVGKSIAEIERSLIDKTLEHFEGNRTQTAEALGISLKTLYNKLNTYSKIDS